MASQSFLIHEITERSIDVERFGNTTYRQAIEFLPGLLARVTAILEETPSDRLFVVAQQVEALVIAEFTDMSDEVKASLAQFAEVESDWAQDLIVEATTLETVRPVPTQVLAAFTQRPMVFSAQPNTRPLTIDQMFDNLAVGKGQAAAQIFRDGQLTGATVDEMTTELDNLIGPVSRRDIQTEVLTSNKHVSEQARSATYSANDDIIEEEEFVVTLDDRTSAACKGLSGNRYPIGQGDFPPVHRRCRSVRIPVIKEQFRIPVKGGTQASQFGPVSSQLTYTGFLKQRGNAYQDDVLGPTKAKLFRSGKFTLSDFIAQGGEPLTLDQIRARKPNAYDDVIGE